MTLRAHRVYNLPPTDPPNNSHYCIKVETTNRIIKGYIHTNCNGLSFYPCTPTLINVGLQNNNCTMPTAIGVRFFETTMKEEINDDPIYSVCLCNDNPTNQVTCNEAAQLNISNIPFLILISLCTIKIV